MPKNVQIPGIGVVQFPDSMTDEQITAKAQELSRSIAPQQEGAARLNSMMGGAPFSQAMIQGSKAEGRVMPEGVPQQAAAAAAPNVLPVVGTAIGGLAGPVPAAAGGVLGEMGNQALGLTEPSVLGPVLAAAGPLVGAAMGRGGGAAFQAGARRIPGASQTLHEAASENLVKIPPRIPIIPETELAKLRNTFPQLGPSVTKDQLYELVNHFNPNIKMDKMRTAVTDLLSKEEQAAAGLKLPSVATTGEDLAARATAGTQSPAGTMSFQDVRVNLKRIGDKIRETKEAGGEEYGAWKKIYAAMRDDLDTAAAQGNPAMPAVQALKAANHAARREFAVDEIANIMSQKGGGITLRSDLAAMPNGEPQIQVNLNRILNAIRKSDDLKRSLSPEELDAMVKDLAAMARKVPVLPPPSGANVGSFQRMGQVTRGLGIMGAGGVAAGTGMLGTETGAALTGGAMAVNAFGPMVLARAIATPMGREFLRRTLTQSGGTLSADALAIIGSAVGTSEYARQAAGGAVQLGQAFMGEPQ